MQEADFIVIGGGLFGVFTAIYLAEKNYKVCLLEKEEQLFTKASLVNQARLHGGYHYPRSIATALMAHEYKDRFAAEHKPFINDQFKNYYAIDKFSSFTTSGQFERFCGFVKAPAKRVQNHPLFNFEQIEALFLTAEYTFDAVSLSRYYTEKIFANRNIEIILQAKLLLADQVRDRWEITYNLSAEPDLKNIAATTVINATYAGTNAINALFEMPLIDLMYQISEIALVRCPSFNHIGVTIVDGPFTSCIPHGHSGLSSLTSVPYTHHEYSSDQLPEFQCQKKNKECLPDYLANCNTCQAKPASNQHKMIAQIKRYLTNAVQMDYDQSLFTVKTKLKSSYIDDGRPTEISKLNALPAYYCLFSGKINSIYEIEKLIANEF